MLALWSAHSNSSSKVYSDMYAMKPACGTFVKLVSLIANDLWNFPIWNNLMIESAKPACSDGDLNQSKT